MSLSGLEGRALIEGSATGVAIVLEEPLSFWGGFDPDSGRVIDRHHPQAGEILTGLIVVMPGGRGSSSSSSVLAEAVRAGTGPAGIVLGSPDSIIALGALVARELYGKVLPVVVVGDSYGKLVSGMSLAISGSRVTVESLP
jgi:predicted aconitase with swiveling domain